MINRRPASTLLYTIMILSAILILTQQLIRSVFVGSHFTKTMVERERAEMLALGGINVAIGLLAYDEKDDEPSQAAGATKPSTGQEKDEGAPKGVKRLLNNALRYLNRWHDFPLTEKNDGIDGLMRICITCEQGKININEAFDFKKMEFKKEYAQLFKGLVLPGWPEGELLNRLTEFFKKRKRKLDDITELLDVPGMNKLGEIFYTPPVKPSKGKKGEPQGLTVQDLFTIWTKDDKLDLLWLSNSVSMVLRLRQPLADDPTVRKDRYNQFLKSFKKEQAKDWLENWKILEPWFGEKPKSLADYKNIFSKQFGPEVFSVLSCGKVGNVEQSVLAVIRNEEERDDSDKQQGKQPQAQKGQKDAKKKFRVLRVYWL
jgi:hypothetical protein